MINSKTCLKKYNKHLDWQMSRVDHEKYKIISLLKKVQLEKAELYYVYNNNIIMNDHEDVGGYLEGLL